MLFPSTYETDYAGELTPKFRALQGAWPPGIALVSSLFASHLQLGRASSCCSRLVASFPRSNTTNGDALGLIVRQQPERAS
jgi:hypothetical protein